MSMTREAFHWHDVYETLNDGQKLVIDEAYKAVVDSIKLGSYKLQACGDDRAEELVAAIMKYVVECNPGHFKV